MWVISSAENGAQIFSERFEIRIPTMTNVARHVQSQLGEDFKIARICIEETRLMLIDKDLRVVLYGYDNDQLLITPIDFGPNYKIKDVFMI